jgi:hypothetical protein
MKHIAAGASQGARFGFGRNWRRFLAGLSEERILAGERLLRKRIHAYFRTRGFALEQLVSCGSKHACNEFTFRKCVSCS